MSSSPEDIISYWLGPEDTSPELFNQKQTNWYASSTEIDDDIRRRFGETLHQAEMGELDQWLESTPGSLALVILFDQFSRNLYRGSAGVYKNDPLALSTAVSLIDANAHQLLNVPSRILLYHPLHHAEDRALQLRVVSLYENLLSSADHEWHKIINDHLSFARGHSELVMRFGRFPHRNAILGRASTVDELAHLEQDKRDYGQSKSGQIKSGQTKTDNQHNDH